MKDHIVRGKKDVQQGAALALALLFLVLSFIPPLARAEQAPGGEGIDLKMHPLEQMLAPEGAGYKSSDEEVATVTSQGLIKSFIEGECVITLTTKGQEVAYNLLVSDQVPTEQVKEAIAIALNEWSEVGERKLGKTNKYTRWRCKKDCSFGWCGAFIGWAMDEAGVEMCAAKEAAPVEKDATFAIREAGVGKILTGYTKLERLTRIPRPGYLTIYGVRKRANKTVHVGLITDVEPIEGDIYLVSTVEGNIGTKIKRYQYYYDASQEARDAQENIFSIEEEKQIQEGMNYTYAVDTWYINIIGQTYE